MTPGFDRPVRVVVRGGGTGMLGRRVLERLEADPAIEIAAAASEISPAEISPAEISPAEISPAEISPVDIIVDIGIADHDVVARRRRSVTVGAAELLEDLDRVGASHLVLVSSAMVYGAVENNPVPLTEEAVVRPDPQFAYARQLATAEWMVEQWRRAGSGRTVTVLRPAIMMSHDASSGLARALAAGFGQRFARTDPGSQFVHLDDVAAAVAIAVIQRLDGVYNVAPDGWIPGERLLALTGDTVRLPVPERVGEVIEALRWRFRRGPIPPGLRAYTREPWLISNDKIKATGWLPTVTNEQVYVEGTEGTWWSTISPQRRQELALAAAIAAALSAVAVVLSLGIGWRRRRRRQRS